MATLVTGYYNLERDDEYYVYGQGRPHAIYMQHGESILSIKMNLIMFCSPDHADEITLKRSNACPEFPIHLIPIKFTELPKYRYYPEMLDLMGRKIHKKYSPGYHLVVHSKVDFMLRAIQENPFKSDFFIWIDFGIRHVTEIPSGIEDSISRLSKNIKLRFDIITHIPDKVPIEDIVKFCSNEASYVAGGCFMGINQSLIEFCQEVNSYFDKVLKQKFICLEEKLFAFYISRKKESVQPYIARFTSILYNIEKLQRDQDLYLDILTKESNNSTDLIIPLCNYGIGSEISKTLLFKVYDIKMLKSWYSQRKDEGVLVILKMIQLLKHPEVKSIFDNNIDYYINNFGYFIDYYGSKIDPLNK